MTTRCFSCDGRVIWTTTKNGNKMPVNQDPVPNGNIRLDGNMAVVMTQEEMASYAGTRYISHHAVCPKAKDWRGKHR